MFSELGPGVGAEPLGKNSQKDRELHAVEGSDEVERTICGTFRTLEAGPLAGGVDSR